MGTGATCADAAAEYSRYVERERGRKPPTLRGYRSTIQVHLLPAFGWTALEQVTPAAIGGWLAGSGGSVRSRNDTAWKQVRAATLEPRCRLLLLATDGRPVTIRLP